MAFEHRIQNEERPLARALWEEVFPEDTPAFLDAFCALKGDNVILGVTEREAAGKGPGKEHAADGPEHTADRLAAMIQLDRCRLAYGRTGGAANVVGADYIVGVSTLPEYRHCGLMRTLLAEAAREGAAQKDPFLFLMPANEQVYLPFGFRTVYLQTNFLAADAAALTAAGRIAGPEDCAALAEAASRVLADEFDTFLIRDERYFRDLITEMGAEDGKVIVLPAGYLCFWPSEDGGALVRELVLPGADRERFIREHGLRPVSVPEPAERRGGSKDANDPEAPKIMVRPLDPAEFVKPLHSTVTQTFTLAYRDDILDMYDGGWSLTVGPEGASLTRPDPDPAAPAPRYELDPASLAEWVFGVRELPGITGLLRPDRILINEWI